MNKEENINVGQYNYLNIVKTVDFGLYLDGGAAGEILMPTRFVPENIDLEKPLKVFVYHDSDNRLIATNQTPFGVVGDIVSLRVVDQNHQGAFMDWGLMKDLFVPLSQQLSRMQIGYKYIVCIYLDEQTGRVAATEKIWQFINNEIIELKEKEEVDLLIWNKSDLGFNVIINSRYEGLIHASDIFSEIKTGESYKGYIKKIRENNTIDVALGTRGYQRVETEKDKILRLLTENNNYLPYNDKSAPEDIYTFFSMSKKAFKMALGALYKERIIEFTQTGIKKN